jgi:hypothetical protein
MKDDDSTDSPFYYCIEYCSSHINKPRRKHPNRKTFVAGNRWKWSRYSTSQIRDEFGYPLWSDYENYKRIVSLYGSPREYGKIYRKYAGEPPRFNLKWIRYRQYEKGLQKGIKLSFRLLRSKNSWV